MEGSSPKSKPTLTDNLHSAGSKYNAPCFLHHNVVIDGKTWLCGVGNKHAKIMFIVPTVLEEEASEVTNLGYGKTAKRTPRLLECGHGVLLKRIALKEGLDLEDCWYTSIVKYLPDDRRHRTKPLQSMIQQAWPYLEKEIDRIQPSIIVAVGKLAFDNLVNFKAKESDVCGAWFYNTKYNAKVYMIPHITSVVKPEKYERFSLDFRTIKSMADASIKANKMEVNSLIIRTANELKSFTEYLQKLNAKVLSIDCEWEGHQHVDGKLRSLQIAWNETDAAYIRFMDDQLNYTFDVSYAEAGNILGAWLNNPEVKYIGHHVSADLMWISHWLGLDWYQKAIFDTEFALQCCDEALDLGLDILALRYTDFGKYDWDLIWWRKKNPDKRGDGYGLVPDNILIPYAIKDVLTVYRAWKPIESWLERQQLTKYYNEILNPFVTDVFTFFGLQGLPIDKEKMDSMRELYQWAKRELEINFKSVIAAEADALLEKALREHFKPKIAGDAMDVDTFVKRAKELIDGRDEHVNELLSKGVDLVSSGPKIMPVIEHYIIAPEFNIRSKPQMQRWLFDVKCYTPVKSTANKAEGIPAVDWEKIEQYPKEKQRLFTPATDKGTLEILASRYNDATIRTLLELNSVGNICKAFLRSADTDENGEIVAEKGLHYWLASDQAIHLMHSTTETGRPRSWNPNVLNWPSYIHKRLNQGLTNIIAKRKEENQIPPFIKPYADGAGFPTIRSVCMARPGWCIVEADYQTAEMRGLAFISGDRDLMRMILEPDDCFGIPKPECLPPGVDAEDCVVRLKFPEYVTFPEDKDKFIMTYAADNAIKAKFTDDQLQRDENGNLVHPRFDMHWQVCELSRNTAREVMNKKKDRGAAKVVNFSSSYGGTATSIARKIEADTGIKSTAEEAQSLLDAVEKRQPRATEFFKEMEQVPELQGLLRAPSGRVRHCHTMAKGISGMRRVREGQLSSLGRECRNFP